MLGVGEANQPSVVAFHDFLAAGTNIVARDAGETSLRPTAFGDAVSASLVTESAGLFSTQMTLTLWSPNGQTLFVPAAIHNIPQDQAYIIFQLVPSNISSEARSLLVENASQLRSIRTTLYSGSTEIQYSNSFNENQIFNTGCSPFYLEDRTDGFGGTYRQMGTSAGDGVGLFVQLLNPFASPTIDRIEIRLSFDTTSPADTDSNLLISDTEYTSFVGAMPAIDPASPAPPPGPAPTGGSLYDLQGAQSAVLPTGMSTPCNGSGMDSFLKEQTGDRNSFYEGLPGFLVTLSTEHIGLIQKLLEETDQHFRVRVFSMVETQEVVRYQACYMIQEDIAYPELDFFDGKPSMKIRYEETTEVIEVWYESRETRYQISELDFELVKYGEGPRLRHWLKRSKDVIGIVGKGLTIYSLVVNYCNILEEWREVYNPNTNHSGDFCEQGCVGFTDAYADVLGLVNPVFGRWGGLIQILAPYYCLVICEEYEQIVPGSPRHDQLAAAHRFLTDLWVNCP